MDTRVRAISTSILLTMGALFLLQCLFFAIVALKLAVRARFGLLFFLTTFAYHGVITVLLLQRADQFQVEPGGRQLSRVNLANLLTMTRLSSLPTVCFLIILSRRYSVLALLLVFLSLVFLTDLLDGSLSRLTHQVTKIGKQMDSFSDYLLLMVISIAFLVYGLVPLWFFVGIFVRGFVMIIGMFVLTKRRGYLKPETSFMGKASFFSIMVLYAFEIFRLLLVSSSWAGTVGTILEYVVGAILVVSIGDKIRYFTSELKAIEKK